MYFWEKWPKKWKSWPNRSQIIKTAMLRRISHQVKYFLRKIKIQKNLCFFGHFFGKNVWFFSKNYNVLKRKIWKETFLWKNQLFREKNQIFRQKIKFFDKKSNFSTKNQIFRHKNQIFRQKIKFFEKKNQIFREKNQTYREKINFFEKY